MSWHWNSGENRRHGGNWWMVALVIMGVLLISNSGGNWNWGWSWWLIFIIPWFIVPRIWRSMRSASDDQRDADDEYEDEKPKRDQEKPKRSFTSEDGSEFEVIEEERAPRKRRDTPDDIDYV